MQTVKTWFQRYLIGVLAPCLVHCAEPKIQKLDQSSAPAAATAEAKGSRLTDPAPVVSLHTDACAAIKARLSNTYPDLSENFCGAKALGDISLSDVYFSDKKGKPVLTTEEKSSDGVSHLGYASPLYINLGAVDFFEFIVAGIMKKGVGGKSFDPSIKAYEFIPQIPKAPFVVSEYAYKLDFDRSFGDIKLKTSKLGITTRKIYLPDEKLFILAETNTEVLEEGLFKKWGLYLVFQQKDEGTVMWSYLDMKISNLGIHELIKDQFLQMADNIPSQFFENVSRISGE